MDRNFAVIFFALLFSFFPSWSADKIRPNEGAMFGAIESYDANALSKALSQGANPNAQIRDGETLLHWGAKRVNLDAITLLLEAGADPNAKDDRGVTPLHESVFEGFSEQSRFSVVKKLVEAGANVNSIDNNGNDVLSQFVLSDLFSIGDYLIQNGANVHRQDNEGRTILHHAAADGKIGACRMLLKHGANPNLRDDNGNTSLSLAIQNNYPELAISLIPKSTPDTRLLALLDAAATGINDVLKRLIEYKVDINAQQEESGMTPLMLAVENNRFDTVQVLLDRGADPNKKSNPFFGSIQGETALCMASRKKSLEMVMALLAAKADVDAPCGAVMEAATAGSADIVKTLLGGGADVRDRFTGHWRALFTSAENGNTAIAKILLEHGTPVDIRNDTDQTALMVAAANGHTQMIQLLAYYKADLEAINAKRQISDCMENFIGTPLMWAIKNHQQKAINLLTDLGAKPRKQ